ncbi:hypothetical protein Q1695_006830 [Nippostrongylus brasiliensis]|nr:hypothetical protein Q1695_006830 [Nippostrongylus brasiliensis]
MSLLIRPEDHWLQSHPKLFDRIKNVVEVRRLILYNTNLVKLTNQPTMKVQSNAEIEIVDNDNLEVIPAFDIVGGETVAVKVYGNRKLDTKQLQDECKRTGCARNEETKIQNAFTCSLKRPIRTVCRITVDTVALANYQKQFDEIEAVEGALLLKNSHLKAFPKMKMLRKIRQNKLGEPVLIIEDNPELDDISALFKLQIDLNHGVSPEDAVYFNNNPKLCITNEMYQEPFIIKFFKRLPLCESAVQVETNVINPKSITTIILYIILANI